MKWTKQIVLYIVWACLYVLCVALGMIPEPQGLAKAVLVVIAAAFFVPGFFLVYWAMREESRKQLRILRIISVCSLSLTVLALVANFLSVSANEAVGSALYDVLALVSAPMLCGQYWAMSLFLWACLLMSTIPGVILPKK